MLPGLRQREARHQAPADLAQGGPRHSLGLGRGASAWPVGWTPMGAVPAWAALLPGRAQQGRGLGQADEPSSLLLPLAPSVMPAPLRCPPGRPLWCPPLAPTVMPTFGACCAGLAAFWGHPPLLMLSPVPATGVQEGTAQRSPTSCRCEKGAPGPRTPRTHLFLWAAVRAQALRPPARSALQPSGWKPRLSPGRCLRPPTDSQGSQRCRSSRAQHRPGASPAAFCRSCSDGRTKALLFDAAVKRTAQTRLKAASAGLTGARAEPGSARGLLS